MLLRTDVLVKTNMKMYQNIPENINALAYLFRLEPEGEVFAVFAAVRRLFVSEFSSCIFCLM